MKKYFLLLIMMVSLTFVGCDFDDDLDPPNYVSFDTTQTDIGVDGGSTRTFDVKVYSANIVGSDRTVDIVVDESTTLDAAAYSVPATVTIPANSNEGSFTVEVSDVNLDFAGSTLVLDMVPAGELSTGGAISLNVREVCPVGTAETRVSLTFDDYASEISWEIVDTSGEVVAQGGGYSDGDESASSIACLDSGDYQLTVNDVYGDGLASGAVAVISGGAELVSVSGNFGFDETVTFSISEVRTE